MDFYLVDCFCLLAYFSVIFLPLEGGLPVSLAAIVSKAKSYVNCISIHL